MRSKNSPKRQQTTTVNPTAPNNTSSASAGLSSRLSRTKTAPRVLEPVKHYTRSDRARCVRCSRTAPLAGVQHNEPSASKVDDSLPGNIVRSLFWRRMCTIFSMQLSQLIKLEMHNSDVRPVPRCFPVTKCTTRILAAYDTLVTLNRPAVMQIGALPSRHLCGHMKTFESTYWGGPNWKHRERRWWGWQKSFNRSGTAIWQSKPSKLKWALWWREQPESILLWFSQTKIAQHSGSKFLQENNFWSTHCY